MHLLPVTSVSLDESESAIDLDQAPGDIVALSFTDSDLSALAAAYRRDEAGASKPSPRQPEAAPAPALGGSLCREDGGAGAKFVLVRCLGGLDYWRYGLERLRDVCGEAGVKLAVLPGDDRPDERLAAFSTVPPALVEELDACFRAGGGRQHARAFAAHRAGDRRTCRSRGGSSLAARLRVVAG